MNNINSLENKELYDFDVSVIISDKFMKPQNLQNVKTNERVSWNEFVTVSDVENEEDAKVAALMMLHRIWSPNQYYIKILESTKK
jgi:hypothetical protein